MQTKRFALLLLFGLIQLNSYSLDRENHFELTINPSQITNDKQCKVLVEVYNGYDLVITKTISQNVPITINLDLYCNYTLVVKLNGRKSATYQISTEVPTKLKKNWKLALSLPYLGNGEDMDTIESKQCSISYQEDARSFNTVEYKSPMAEKKTNDSNTLVLSKTQTN